MDYRTFGHTDLKVSEIGLGCQSIGGGLYHKDDQEALRTFDRAFDSGVNFFDTADHYSQGNSERLLGRAFQGKRDRVILATKAGMVYSQAGRLALAMRPLLRPARRILEPMKIAFHLMRASQKRHVFSEAYLTEAVHASLKRLQTDYIDLFQLHKPDSDLIDKGDFLGTLEKLKAQGKVRHYGISCATVDDALLCLRHPEIASVQVTVNLLEQEAITKYLPIAKERNVAVIIRNPRAQGHLTDRLGDITGETYARNQAEFREKQDRARRFLFLVGEGRTLAQAALRFVLRLEGVSAVIPRANNREQLEENLGALKAPSLTDEELVRIESRDARHEMVRQKKG
jgi:aryl-alcohol dehydrogenase-like predicted oxidoreductase